MTHDKRSRLDALISEEAAEWFIEFRTGDIDAARRHEFDAWVRASPEHLRAYIEVAAIWNEASALGAQRRVSTDELVELARSEGNVVPWGLSGVATPGASDTAASGAQGSLRHSSSNAAPRGRLWYRRLSLAAALLVVLTGGAVWLQLDRSPEYSTDVGEQRSLRLSDGSTVELNSRSKVRVRFTSAERVVDLLEGQALFHVATNAARPFIVRSAKTNVRAVGTRFDVYRKKSGTVVTVLEGRVAVSAPIVATADSGGSASMPPDLPGAEDLGVLLSAGEQLAVTAQATSGPKHANVAAATAWTQRQLILDSAVLSQVAEEFNRYSARKLVAEDHGVPKLRLSGVFTTDPDFLIRYLRERPDITVTETSTEVRIVRQPHS